MDNAAVSILIYVLGLITASLGWLIRLFLARRKIILVEHTTSRSLGQLPEIATDELTLVYQGKLVPGFYDNTFIISNQSLDTIRDLGLQLQVGTPGTILKAVLVNRVAERTASVNFHSTGKQVIVKANFLNSSRTLGDKLELHIFSDQPLEKVDVEGGGPGWAIKYRGQIVAGSVVVSVATAKALIGVEGPIGVGKTTLARLLQKKWNADILFETFEDNPFLADFYADRERYAFHTQLFFLLARYYHLRDVYPTNRPLVSDYIFVKDSIFAKLNLHSNELTIYQRVYGALQEHTPKPDLVIYLKADVDTLMGRIKARGRPYERDMDRRYIEQLSQAYENFFATYEAAPVLIIDTTNLDLVNSAEDLSTVLERIESTILRPKL